MVDDRRNPQKSSRSQQHTTTTPTTANTSSKSIGAEFVCRQKFQNNLPEITSIGPQFLAHDNESAVKKLVPWVLSDLERNYKYRMHDENLLAGIPFDLLHLDRYEALAEEGLGLEDQELLDEVGKIPGMMTDIQGKKSFKSVRPEVSWLRRTEYISSEFSKTRAGAGGKGLNGASSSSSLEQLSVESQIKVIEDSFKRKPLKSLKHPKKPDSVVAVESYDILPNFEMWDQVLSTCFFDDDPKHKPSKPFNVMSEDEKALYESLQSVRLEQANHSVLHGFSNPDKATDKYLMYFLPKEDVMMMMKKNDVDDGNNDDDDYDPLTQDQQPLIHARDYNFTLTPENSANYIFTQDHGGRGVYRYVPLHSRIILRKRRAGGEHHQQQQQQSQQSDVESVGKPNLYRIERQQSNGGLVADKDEKRREELLLSLL